VAKLTKPEAENAIRDFATKWFRQTHSGVADPSTVMPSFADFVSWILYQGYGDCLQFRSVAGPLEDAERWFDEELKQTWRN
jgi:hypothetical protein